MQESSEKKTSTTINTAQKDSSPSLPDLKKKAQEIELILAH
jgi:hypothetical protein